MFFISLSLSMIPPAFAASSECGYARSQYEMEAFTVERRVDDLWSCRIRGDRSCGLERHTAERGINDLLHLEHKTNTACGFRAVSTECHPLWKKFKEMGMSLKALKRTDHETRTIATYYYFDKENKNDKNISYADLMTLLKLKPNENTMHMFMCIHFYRDLEARRTVR